jgi:DNA invertase Pin-like site-specific DNA recombinase
MIYGYIRVSTTDQNEDRQLICFQELGIPQEQIYIDKQSGKDFDRLKYTELMAKLKQGDLLYVKSIKRLGRNYEEIQNQWRIITKEKGVDIFVVDMPILDTRARHESDLIGKVICDVVLQLLSFVAQNELDDIHKRQAEGIKAARLRGVKFGRPKRVLPDNFGKLVEKWERREIKTSEMLNRCKISRSTFYVKLKEHKESCRVNG